MGVTRIPDNKLNTGVGQTPSTVTVTNSTTTVVAANTSRKWCYITNVGNRDVFLALGQSAVVDQGFLLERNGGSMLVDSTNHCTQALNGITSSGSSSLIFQEGI